jgi:two-component system, NarL family, sensor histidine kinase DesK
VIRLLPRDQEIGWTPYVWLIYLAFFFLTPVLSRAGAGEWALTVLGAAVFLVLYFRGFWLRGRRLLPIVAAITLLGVLYTPTNWGAAAFFIYAAAFVGRLGPPPVAVRFLGGVVAVVALETWLVGLPLQASIPALVFSVLIGGVNIHHTEVCRANARLRMAQEEVERLATLAERERIARDLHDLLGHTLSVITLKSELAARLTAGDPARAAAEMREVETISRQALSEVRKAVRGYRFLSLDAELAKARVALGAAEVDLAVEASPYDLAAEEESAVALALREAVTNVVRHARAGRCRVAMSQRDGEFRLEVSDDGRGGTAPEGDGLAGMRERIEALGGRVERDGAAGTRLSVVLPLGTRRQAPPAEATA